MVAHVLDDYYLAITLLVTVGYQLTGFAIAWTLQFDKITDFTGGSNFFILALLTLLLNGVYNARNIVASVLAMVWAVRLAGFLLYRVLKTGSDTRFDDIRAGFLSFLGFWIGQIVWVWTVMLPITILNSPAVAEPFPNPPFGTSRDIAGIVLWAIGWLIETIADADKFRWKSSKPSKAEFMTRGIWGWSRHPPYFGEMMCWWGIWILSISPSTDGQVTFQAKQAQYAALASPIFTVILLMFASGVPTAEKPMAKRMYLISFGATARTDHSGAWQAYKEYLNRTSILIPLPPILYRPLPQFVKRYLLFDFPMYQFDEDKDGKQALEEQ